MDYRCCEVANHWKEKEMPRRGEKVTENHKNTGDGRLSNSALYRKSVKSSELRNAQEERRPGKVMEYESPQSDGKNELPWYGSNMFT